LRTILAACETVRDEIAKCMGDLGQERPVIWMEGGLHGSPERLRRRLSEVLREADGRCGRLLLCVGCCGGGMGAAAAGNYETVLPLTNDCLSLLLGSLAARKRASAPATYFLTRGWLTHEENLVASFEKASERFGRKTALSLTRALLDGYSRFGLLDTGAYDLKEAEGMVLPLARSLNMSVEAVPCDLSWLRRFLEGPWDDPDLFLRLPPGAELRFEDWSRLFARQRDADELCAAECRK
jgi:hypothetical protein